MGRDVVCRLLQPRGELPAAGERDDRSPCHGRPSNAGARYPRVCRKTSSTSPGQHECGRDRDSDRRHSCQWRRQRCQRGVEDASCHGGPARASAHPRAHQASVADNDPDDSAHPSWPHSILGSVPLASALTVLVATNVVTNTLATDLYLPICLTAAALLLLISRWAGLTRADLGLGAATTRSGLIWGLAAAAVVVTVYLVGLAVPITRDAFLDERAARLSVGAMLWYALVRVPLGTVLLEELGFRGVLWALIGRRLGQAWATGISSALFGLWHVLPSIGITRANAAAGEFFGQGGTGQLAAVLAAVAGTAAAGVILCELRRRTGSLLAPASLHCATNGFGYLLAWAATR
jgi:uncharacterized protein